jgi:hypothetical protein
MKPSNHNNARKNPKNSFRIPRINQQRASGYPLPAEEQMRHLLVTLISTFQGLFTTLFPAPSAILVSNFDQPTRNRNNNGNNSNNTNNPEQLSTNNATTEQPNQQPIPQR